MDIMFEFLVYIMHTTRILWPGNMNPYVAKQWQLQWSFRQLLSILERRITGIWRETLSDFILLLQVVRILWKQFRNSFLFEIYKQRFTKACQTPLNLVLLILSCLTVQVSVLIWSWLCDSWLGWHDRMIRHCCAGMPGCAFLLMLPYPVLRLPCAAETGETPPTGNANGSFP